MHSEEGIYINRVVVLSERNDGEFSFCSDSRENSLAVSEIGGVECVIQDQQSCNC